MQVYDSYIKGPATEQGNSFFYHQKTKMLMQITI